MTIYVDEDRTPARIQRRTSRWCHLFSDTSDAELHDFAQLIGLKRSWFQDAGHPLQVFRHYAVSESKRGVAVAAGAVEVTWREVARLSLAGRDRLGAAHAQTITREDQPSDDLRG